MSTNSLFDGPTTESDVAAQNQRLGTQLVKVYRIMATGNWYTLDEIADSLGAPTTSIAARIRDLRKHRFGGFKIDRRHDTDGLHEYRLVPGSGDIEYVYHPASESNSRKPVARRRLRAFIEAHRATGRPDFITSINGNPLLISDIEDMLR